MRLRREDGTHTHGRRGAGIRLPSERRVITSCFETPANRHTKTFLSRKAADAGQSSSKQKPQSQDISEIQHEHRGSDYRSTVVPNATINPFGCAVKLVCMCRTRRGVKIIYQAWSLDLDHLPSTRFATNLISKYRHAFCPGVDRKIGTCRVHVPVRGNIATSHGKRPPLAIIAPPL